MRDYIKIAEAFLAEMPQMIEPLVVDPERLEAHLSHVVSLGEEPFGELPGGVTLTRTPSDPGDEFYCIFQERRDHSAESGARRPSIPREGDH